MADAPATDSPPRLVEQSSVLPLLASITASLLVLATLCWFLLEGLVRPGAARFGVTVLILAATIGIAGGAWSLARQGGDGGRPGRGENRRRESPESLQTIVAHQAAAIARYQEELQNARTELEITHARLAETSFKDELTGLYNRRFFFVRLEEEISRHRRFGHPVAVVLFDLDGFKEVNDGQGHMIGDETLREIGQLLTKHSRGINVVARYGGDEFVILLVETSKEGARLYAERIRQIISGHPYSHGMHVTASFGVASLPDDPVATGEDLVRIADEALYVAKRGGKNQVAGAQSPETESA